MVSRKIKKNNRKNKKYRKSVKLGRKQKGGDFKFEADKLPKKKANYPNALFGWSPRTFILNDSKKTLQYFKGDQEKGTLQEKGMLKFNEPGWELERVEGAGNKIVIKKNGKNHLVLRFEDSAEALTKGNLINSVLAPVEQERAVPTVTEEEANEKAQEEAAENAAAIERARENSFGPNWHRTKIQEEAKIREAMENDNLGMLVQLLNQIYVTHKTPLLDEKLIKEANEKKTKLAAVVEMPTPPTPTFNMREAMEAKIPFDELNSVGQDAVQKIFTPEGWNNIIDKTGGKKIRKRKTSKSHKKRRKSRMGRSPHKTRR